MEYYSAIKDEILSFVTWMDIENIMLSEINKTGKSQEPYEFTHIWEIEQNNK